MLEYLDTNGPWSQLISLGNIERRVVEFDRAIAMGGGVRVTAFRVPHRDEYSDTVGYRIDGPRAIRGVHSRHRPLGEMGA